MRWPVVVAQTDITNVSAWEKHGLQGLVILALFILGGVAIKYTVGLIKELIGNHAIERDRWAQNDKEAQAAHLATLKDMATSHVETMAEVKTALVVVKDELYDLHAEVLEIIKEKHNKE